MRGTGASVQSQSQEHSRGALASSSRASPALLKYEQERPLAQQRHLQLEPESPLTPYSPLTPGTPQSPLTPETPMPTTPATRPRSR